MHKILPQWFYIRTNLVFTLQSSRNAKNKPAGPFFDPTVSLKKGKTILHSHRNNTKSRISQRKGINYQPILINSYQTKTKNYVIVLLRPFRAKREHYFVFLSKNILFLNISCLSYFTFHANSSSSCHLVY